MMKTFRAALTAAVFSSAVVSIPPAIAQGSCPFQSSGCVLDSISRPFDVGTLGGALSLPQGLNAHGQVVGTSGTSDGAARAYSWTQASGIQELAALPGARNSAAGSVSASGQIVGSSEDGQRVSHAVLWTQAGASPQDLGTLSVQGAAAGPVSDNGQVLISSQDGLHGLFLWTIGSTPPGSVVPPPLSQLRLHPAHGAEPWWAGHRAKQYLRFILQPPANHTWLLVGIGKPAK